MSFHIDMKLASISIEIHALKDGFELIESTIEKLNDNEKDKLEKALRNGLCKNDEDLIDLHRELNDKVNVFYPRLFWGPYLISIFSVFESCTQEITEYIRENKECSLRLDDIKGDLLKKLKIYYPSVLNNDFFLNHRTWKKLNDLSKIRNCFAHSNGRLNYLKPNKHDGVILKLIEQNVGVSEHLGVVVVSSKFVKNCLDSVLEVIEGLKDQYIKIYDTMM